MLVVALNGNYKKNHRHLTSLVKYLVDQEIKVSFLFHDPKVEIDKKGLATRTAESPNLLSEKE